MKRKIFSILLVSSMIFGVLPINHVQASGEEEPLTIEKVDFMTTSIEKERTSDDTKLLENYKKIKTQAPLLSDDGKRIILPSCDEGFEVSLYGTSNPAVIDMDGNVTQPLEDMEVYLFYQIKNINTKESLHMDDPVKVIVNGKYNDEYKGINRPEIIPGIREWKGENGTFSFSGNIVISDESLKEPATKVAYYIREMTDFEPKIVQGKAQNGDLYLEFNPKLTVGVEGYTMEIRDVLTVQATDYIGFVYAGATITQMLMQNTTIPQGEMRDYPQYKVRSTMFDVARFYMPLDYVEEVTKYAAFFKMNEIHLHINDCGGEQEAAFRVESKKYPDLNKGIPKEEVYSQEDYINFQKRMKKLGVDIVTEIDTPAHATSFWYVNPSIMLDSVHVNIYDENARNFVKSVYDEFLDPNHPVFLGKAFNVGVDEYPPGNNEQVRAYMDEMIKYIDGKGIEARLWSGLNDVVSDQPYTGYAGDTPVSNKGVFHFYNDAVADLTIMLEGEYRMINNMYQNLYIVPVVVNGTNDYLDLKKVYDSWEAGIVSFGEGEIMPGHPLLLGSETSIWNDAKVGCSEFDLFERAKDQIMLMSEKNWYGRKGIDQTSEEFINRVSTLANEAPGSNPARYISSESTMIVNYHFKDGNKDLSQNGYHATIHNLSVDEEMEALKLDGNGYISLPFNSVGYPYTIDFEMYISSDTPANATMFSGKDGELIYNIDGTGKVGFKRKGYTYIFDYMIPTDEMVHFTLLCKEAKTYLSTADSFQIEADLYNTSVYVKGSSSFVLPTEKIGSGIKGYMKSLTISKDENNAVNIENVALHKEVTISAPEGGYNEDGSYVYPQFDKNNVTDGNSYTRTSLEYKDDAWIQIDLGETYLLDLIQIEFTNQPISYELYLSVDGKDWELVDIRKDLVGGISSSEAHSFSNCKKARYIKYQQTKMWYHTAQDFYYSSGISEIKANGLPLNVVQNILDDAANCLESVPNTDETHNIRYRLEENIAICNDLMNKGQCKEILNVILVIQQLCDKLTGGDYEIPQTNKTILKELLDEKIDTSELNSQLVHIYLDALEKGRIVYYDINATQKKIDLAVSMIQEARDKMMNPNVALNKPVTVSGVEGGYKEDGSLVYPQFDPMHATDGDMGTRISLNYEDDAWVQVDLNGMYSLNFINIHFSQRPVGYKVIVSRDGVNWITIDEKSNLEGGSSGLDEIVFTKNIEARYVRYQQTKMWYSEVAGAQYYSGNFFEFEVYGKPVEFENVSIGKTVEISAPEGGYNEDGSFVYPQFNPQHVTDNDFNTRTSLEYEDDAWIKVDLGKEYYLDTITTCITNQPISFEIYISKDGNDWELVDSKDQLIGGEAGTFETIISESKKARYVKFQQTKMWYHPEHEQYYSAGVSEIHVLGREVPDTTKLKNLVDSCEKLNQIYFTEDSWSLFFTRLTEAKKILVDDYLIESEVNDAYERLEKAYDILQYKSADYSEVEAAKGRVPKDLSVYTEASVKVLKEALDRVVEGKKITEQEAVDKMANDIQKAIKALVYKAADYTEVDKAIAKAEALNPEDYEDFSAVIKAMEAVERDLDITHQKEVDAMAKAIEEAIDNLKEKSEEIPVDKGELEEVVEEASQLKKEEYTEATWNVFEKVLATAKEVLANEEATEEDVVEAIEALKAAIAQLEKKPTITPEPEPDPEQPGEGEGNEGETTPETGDTTNATALFMMLVLAGGVLAVLNKNKIVKFLSKK